MNKLKLSLSILAIPLGVFLFVYGGYDDSPGAQLIGFAVAVAGIIGIIRSRKKSSMQNP